MITVASLPERTNIINGEISTWGSIRQPYLFAFWRKDIDFTGLTNVGGFIRINKTGLNLYGYTPVVGEQITLVNNSTKDKKVGKVTAWTAGSAIDTDIPWDINFSGAGWANFSKREAYKIRIAITGFIPSQQKTVNLGMAEGTPDSIGRCFIDVSGLLTYGCEKTNTWDFGLASGSTIAIDYSGWIRFTTEYDDVFFYNGVQSTTTKITSTTQYYGIDGVKQLLSPYGQNFADHLPTVITKYPAKFLTKFPRLYYFKNYPFSISTIIRDQLKNSNWFLFLETGPPSIAPYTQPLTGFIDDAVVLFTLPGAFINGFVNNKIMWLWLQAKTNAHTYTTQPAGYSDDFPYNQPPTTYSASNVIPNNSSTEMKQVVIKDECKQSPIYLMWKNSLGGWDYWLFAKSNEVNYSASTGDNFDVYIYDLEVQNVSSKIIQASGRKAITVGDIVQQDMTEGFADLERSPAVFILHDPRKLLGNRPQDAWMQVQIAPKGIKYKSQSTEVQIEITVVLPEYFTLPN